MKRVFQPGIYLLVLAGLLSLVNCGKPPLTPPGGGTGTGMYPATMSFYEGGNAAYPTVWTYQYDSKNMLTKFGLDLSWVKEINTHGTNLTTFTPILNSTIACAFSLANQTDTSVSIYTGTPSQVSFTYFFKDPTKGTTSSTAGPLYYMEYGGKLLSKLIVTDGGGRNYNYTYDEKQNLKQIDFVNLSGIHSGQVYSRLKVVALDDKTTPFAQVQGYRFISYPQAYPVDYAWAFCKNNPTQIIVEDFDYTKNAWVTYEKDDFVYKYNDQGYPTTVSIFTSYPGPPATNYTKTYNFTYRN